MPIPTPFNSQIHPDADKVTLTRQDLPAVASVEAYGITLTEGDLIALLADIRSEQLGLTADRTGGL